MSLDPVVIPDDSHDAEAAVDVVRNYSPQRVVGLGGSAGCIPGLQRFLESIPPDTGASFVVVIHLSPEHESRLSQVLQQSTSMPVIQVNESLKMEPNSVYVIPPGKNLSISDGNLRLSEPNQAKGRRVAVDLLFRTLADAHGPSAVAIIFSGGASDGSIGIKRIKETGGLTLAQDPAEAEHPDMPRSCIATGMVDWVLPAEEMPGLLLEYWQNGQRLRLPAAEKKAPAPERRAEDGEEDGEGAAETALREILNFLRDRTGRDFSYYKRATILRRIARRMQVNGVTEATEYLSFLHAHPGEAGALLQDLLISVTNFFRDTEAFRALEAIIPELFANKSRGDSVRVWVAACATGEEAYSVAILLCEYAAKLKDPPAIEVFATDLDEEAIQTARVGLYSEMMEADVNEDRLRRFFSRDHGAYVVKREVRDVIIFALHDLLRDPSFSRCDLVTCRNLLIYLNREAQQRAVEIFHFALRPEGRLFLGTSELLDEGNALFTAEDKLHRIYRRRAVPRTGLPVPMGPGTLALNLKRRGFSRDVPPPSLSLAFKGEWDGRAASRNELHFKMLELYAPPSVVVNEQHDIVHLSERAGQFLGFSGGRPTMDLLQLVHPDLRIPLRTALFRAVQSGEPVAVEGPSMETNGERRRVTLRVIPAQEEVDTFLLVVFDARAEEAPVPGPAEEPVLRHLEQELEQVKSNLRETVEQYEATTEELKASNEELQAMNEELRSATEELETSREELQSINEELTAVNQELKGKVDEVGRANSDLQNLMASTAIATVFLDRELRVSRYTPAAVALFNLIPSDVGRPLSDLNPRLLYPDLAGDAARVLENLALIEREARHVDGRWFHTRLLPYRTTEDQIAGVVLTLIDISMRKRAEEAVRANDALLRADLEAMGLLQQVSERFVQGEKLPGLLKAVGGTACGLMSTTSSSVHLLDPGTRELALVASEGVDPELLRRFSAGSGSSFFSKLLIEGRSLVVEDLPREEMLDGQETSALQEAGVEALVAIPLRTRKAVSLGILTCYFPATFRPSERQLRFLELAARQAADAIERTQAEEDLRQSEERLRVAMEAGKMGIWDLDLPTGRVQWSVEHNRILGLPEEQRIGTIEQVMERVHPEDRERVEQRVQTCLEGEGHYESAMRVRRQDGTWRWVAAIGHGFFDAAGKPYRMIGVVSDITARKEAAEALRAREAWLRLMIENASEYAIFASDEHRRVTYWNSGAERLLGYTESEICGQLMDVIFTPEDVAEGRPEMETAIARREGRAMDERWHMKKDGIRFWASGALMLMRDDADEVAGFVKILRDQTEERAAQEALMKSREELWTALQENERVRAEIERASKAKDHFLAVLSHELRTPLTPVLMAVRTMERQSGLSKLMRDSLAMIRRNIGIEAHFIDDLLDITRITHGKLELVYQEVNLHEAVHHAVEITRGDLEHRGQRLKVKLEAQEFVLWGDRTRLEQVFWNLLKNASKFMPKGGKVTVHSWNEGGNILVSVTDEGMGIASESLQSIFNAFSQETQEVTQKFGGLGLGLAIAKATMDAHGGELHAESPGRDLGSTFTVVLPLRHSLPAGRLDQGSP